MTITHRMHNIIRGVRQRWGTTAMKQTLWNKEFNEGRWDVRIRTEGDEIYKYLGKYSDGGSILDLGCGAGNTGYELLEECYSAYTGVDISDVAIAAAVARSAQAGRSKNRYFQADILTYVPDRKHHVILFRESLYYVPRTRIPHLLLRYGNFLDENGVFVVRWHDKEQGLMIFDLLPAGYTELERAVPRDVGPLIAVFAPPHSRMVSRRQAG